MKVQVWGKSHTQNHNGKKKGAETNYQSFNMAVSFRVFPDRTAHQNVKSENFKEQIHIYILYFILIQTWKWLTSNSLLIHTFPYCVGTQIMHFTDSTNIHTKKTFKYPLYFYIFASLAAHLFGHALSGAQHLLLCWEWWPGSAHCTHRGSQTGNFLKE